jgi:hypothetical protein
LLAFANFRPYNSSSAAFKIAAQENTQYMENQQTTCQHGVLFSESCHAGDCFRDGQTDRAILVHAFVQRHLAGGADNYAIALLLEKAGYTFRDLSDALISGRGM